MTGKLKNTIIGLLLISNAAGDIFAYQNARHQNEINKQLETELYNESKENQELAKDIYDLETILNQKQEELDKAYNDVDSLQKQLSTKKASQNANGSTSGSGRVMTLEVTAYTAGDGNTPSMIMANGERVHEGAVAMNGVPLGTRVRIDGNIYTVKDRCGYDGVVDIYMSSHQACLNWGRRVKNVEIL